MLSNVKVVAVCCFTATVQVFPSPTSKSYATLSPEPFVYYAWYQCSQLAIPKHLQSEVAYLRGEIYKLAEYLAKLSTTFLLDEATVSQLPTSNMIVH